MPALWIAKLMISDAVAQKIAGRHHLDVELLAQALVCQAGLVFTWDHHPERGSRAIVETYLGDRRVLVVLYPANDPLGDVWNLGSAYPV